MKELSEMSSADDASSGDAHPSNKPTPVVLTAEELKVLKECRFNSIVYRGIPVGLVSVATARVVVQAGYFRKWSGLFYTGMLSLGFLSGVGSYRNTCMEKIMALENSKLGDQIRNLRKNAGIPVTEIDRHQSADDQNNPIDFGVTSEKTLADDFESPLNKRLESSSQWDEIRKQSRQAHTSNGRGMTYDELRRANRANQLAEPRRVIPDGENEHHAPTPPPSSDTGSFRSQYFDSDDNKSSALDFSKSDESRMSSFLDGQNDNYDKRSTELPKKRGIPHKNKYGDDME